jgi:hypothetical protein
VPRDFGLVHLRVRCQQAVDHRVPTLEPMLRDRLDQRPLPAVRVRAWTRSPR